MRLGLLTFSAALTIAPSFCQRYEFGAMGGGSFSDSRTITNTKGNVDGGFDKGFGLSVYLGQNLYTHLSGELRYTFLKNDLKLSGGGTTALFGAQSHAVHYDLLLHATSVDSHIRPYVAVGGGVKYYRATGNETLTQPLSYAALLTKTTQIEPLVSVGAGIKFKLSDRISIRADVHDYLSPIPDNLFAPAQGSKVSGWINNIVPMVGVFFTY